MSDIFYIDDTSKQVLDGMREGVRDATRPRSDGTERLRASIPQGEVSKYLGPAIITEAGADGDHWKWMFALRAAADGTFAGGLMGSDDVGECVIADGGSGGAGTKGLLIEQIGDDGAAMLVLVLLSSRGLHQGDIRQMMTDEEAGWGPAQFGP